MKAEQFAAGLVAGAALVLGGRAAASFEATIPAEVVVDIGEATVALDSLAYGGALALEARRRRTEDERAAQDATASEQAPKLPTFAEEWLGLNTLQARLTKAAQGLSLPERKLNPDSAAFLHSVVADLSQSHRKLSAQNQFIAVLAGVREKLVNEYTGAFLIPVADPNLPEGVMSRRRKLEDVFVVLDWAAKIKSTDQNPDASWQLYTDRQARDRNDRAVAAIRKRTVATSRVA
ncbi:MAG TPA: hypothetical protein VHD60_03850 [Candidatus Saccharimonadales bacterium]|nr:hypothetical protein [Candidatus Saccharimonadales bacterium]